MLEPSPPPREIIRTGYETRDLSMSLVIIAAIILVIGAVVIHIALWQWSLYEVPEQRIEGASPPTLMPGEPGVNDRLQTVPRPRLDPLEPLEANPASYRSSRRLPNSTSPTQRPEDLRADRQPELNRYGWVEKGKVATIPIDAAMDAVVERERSKSGAKKGGGK